MTADIVKLTVDDLAKMSDQELLTISEILETVIDVKRDEHFKSLAERMERGEVIESRMADFENIAHAECVVNSAIYRIMKLRKTTWKMEPLSDIGDHMTMEHFIDCVKYGGFIDYDGFGNYATATEESDMSISPSDVKSGMYRKDFTHVVWYNR